MRFHALVVVSFGLAMSMPAAAAAATGPHDLQRLARAQTELLMAHAVDGQVASPASCDEGQSPRGTMGMFLLATLNFTAGDASFTCSTTRDTVVLDLGGVTATEDTTGDTYTTASGEVLTFERRNLEAICDDVIQNVISSQPATATINGEPITGVPVSTKVFWARVQPGAPLRFYEESVALGHPGRLATTYCGYKAIVPLEMGTNVIEVDLSAFTGSPTHLTYTVVRTR